jgi:YfiH family protein
MSNDLFSSFKRFSCLVIAMSSRKDKNMKVYYDFDEDKRSLRNRKSFLKKQGISEKKVIGVKSVHGNNIEIVSKKHTGTFIDDTDGMITKQKDAYLAITVADCLPIILFEPEKEILTLLHAGWRGLENRIIEKAIKKLHDKYDAKPDKLLAGIGPGIGPCHFEVKDDLLIKFRSYPDAIINRDSLNYIDLKSIAKTQMEHAGIKPDNIEVNPVCTYCQSDKYFSNRKDSCEKVRANIFLAGMRYKNNQQ